MTISDVNIPAWICSAEHQKRLGQNNFSHKKGFKLQPNVKRWKKVQFFGYPPVSTSIDGRLYVHWLYEVSYGVMSWPYQSLKPVSGELARSCVLTTVEVYLLGLFKDLWRNGQNTHKNCIFWKYIVGGAPITPWGWMGVDFLDHKLL